MSEGTPGRELTQAERAVVEELYRRKATMMQAGSLPTHAYVTLTREIRHGDQRDEKVYPPGTTLKIVMVSRFEDCGVTDNMEADHGYFTRFSWTDPTIVDIRWQPTPTREWNEFLSGLIAKAAPSA